MKNILFGLTLIVGIVIGGYYFNNQVGASVSVGNEYNATTTYAAHPSSIRQVKTGWGTLGSVIITGDNTGLMSFYDATTTNVSLRTGNKATSSILIADFPASSPEGTYTYDLVFNDGLLLVTSGDEATSTVTHR